MPRWTKLAVLACLLCAGGCGSDNGTQATERPAPVRPAGEPERPEASTPVDEPVTPGAFGQLAYRPTRLERAATTPIEGIRWKTYGGPTAVGTGIADGKRVTIRLRALSICDHKLTYMEWAIDRVESKKKPEFSAIMETHASLDACDPDPEE